MLYILPFCEGRARSGIIRFPSQANVHDPGSRSHVLTRQRSAFRFPHAECAGTLLARLENAHKSTRRYSCVTLARAAGLEPVTSPVHVFPHFHEGVDYIFTMSRNL